MGSILLQREKFLKTRRRRKLVEKFEIRSK
jgi:hypothetical protein